MQVEHPKDLVKLVPAAIIAGTEGVVLVVTDCLSACSFDSSDRVSGKLNRFIEPHDVRFVLPNHVQQVAVDFGNQGTYRHSSRERGDDSGTGPVRREVEHEGILAKASEA